MTTMRDIFGEAVKALAVLALVFLSFAHQPVAVASADDGFAFSLADLSYCGSSGDGTGDHAPCHACRAGMAGLPPAPCVAEPAHVQLAIIDFPRAAGPAGPGHQYFPASPRAPPALV